MEKKKNKQLNKAKKGLKDYAKYSSLAFQMIFIIIAGVFGGLKLDQYLNSEPIFTVTLSLLSVFAAIYFAIKDFLKKE